MIKLRVPHRAADDARLTRIMLRGELIESGWTDRQLSREVASGALAKVRRGAYVDGGAFRSLDDDGRYELRSRAVVRQANSEVVLSHTSGLPLWDAPLWGLDLREVHATRADGRAGRREAGVCQHRGVIIEGDVVEAHGLRVMHPTRLALETTMVAPVEPALVVVNDLLHRRLTTPEQLAERYAVGMAHWEGSVTSDIVLRLADPRIESVGESRTFFLLWRYGTGIPAPKPNYVIRAQDGEIIGRVDFAWPELRTFMEFDGQEKYLKNRRAGESVTDAILREKRRQELIERQTGWRRIRITWADLAHPQQTVVMIRRALAGVVAA